MKEPGIISGKGTFVTVTATGAIVFGLVLVVTLTMVLWASSCGSSTGSSEVAVTGTPIDARLPEVKLLMPGATGAGEVPRFEWEAVAGAVRYRLSVLDAAGKPLWAWNGAETAVNLGGLPGDRPADISGPVITSVCSWSVVAFDAAGKAMAVSDIRRVSP